ncbi:MAG: MATE family efflux transporter [Candidatus Eisenbacteria bacterium]
MSPPPASHPTRADLRKLFALAAPVVFVQVGLMAMGVVDTILVGRVSADALAAVALGNMYFMTVAMLGMGVLFALDTVISQAVGAGDNAAVARGVQRGLVLAAGMTVPSLLPLLLAHPVFAALGQPAAVVPIAADFVWVSIPGLLPFFGFIVLRQSLQAMGRLRPIVISIVFANVLNALLGWMFIFGKLGAPALGAVGTGVASTIGRWAMALFLLAVAWRDVRPALRPFTRAALDWEPLARMVRLGMPIGLQFVLEVGVFSLVGVMMGRMSAVALAGHQVAITLASLMFMVPLGISVSGAVLVGRAVGRRDADGARRAARLAIATSAVFMSLSALTMLLIPQWIARLYTTDTAVIAVAASLIPIAGVFQVFDGLQVTSGGVLRGFGETRSPMIANLVGYWALGFPISLALAFSAGLGPRGLWWGFVVGLGTVAMFLLWRVRLKLANVPEPVAIDQPPAPGIAQPDPFATAEHPAG